MTDALVVREAGTIQTLNTGNAIGAMLQAVVDKGVTADNAVALEKLTDLYLKVEANNARKEYAAAMAALQAELPGVAATRIIPDKQGNVRSTFANYEDIMGQIRPAIVKHGFSIKFTMRTENNRAVAVCTLTHAGGHSESNEFAVRIGQGPPGCSEAQSDGSAASYAQRNALCDALNIIIRHDNDAAAEGDHITPEQAAHLRARVAATKSDEKRFLDLADATSYETIRAGKLAMLEDALDRKEKRTAPPKPEVDPSTGEVIPANLYPDGQRPK